MRFSPRLIDSPSVLVTDRSGMETMKLRIEVKRGANASSAARTVIGEVKSVFEVTPEVEVLTAGTLAKAFEASIKAPRFVDERE